MKTDFLASGNNLFVNWKQFFLLVETIIETWGKVILKDEIYFC